MQTATQDSVAAIKEISGTTDRITKIARNDAARRPIPPGNRAALFFPGSEASGR